MLGNQKDERGVLEMAAEDIFAHICNTAGRDFLLRVSFVEIYNEIIRDLLSDAPDATVNIREDPKRGVYCEASESVITDYESIIRALKKGISRRAVEATAMNDTSSRSHTIFKLVIESKENGRGDNADPDGAVLVSSLNLVDLAGSESVRHTGATGQRAKEGGKINQSLLSLSRVIHALSQPGAHVSFRDSKLTRLLQPSLSGNAKMSVVCCITPAEKYLEETRSTLQFASRAKLVKTHAVVNEVLDEAAALKRLKKELEELKEKQRVNTGLLSEEEQARIEAEKADMLARLESLQKERDVQLQQLERLKELIVVGEKSTAAAAAAVDRTKRRKRHRDTWCPGATSAVFSLAPATVASDVVVDDENMLDQDDGASAGDRSAGSSKSDTSSGSVIVQALSAQLASRDDVIAALRDQIREMQQQQVPGPNNLAKMDGTDDDEEEEDGDDTVPLEEDDKEAVGQQLAEALVQIQSLAAAVSAKEAQVAELVEALERRAHEAETAAQADAQTESLVRGLEEDAARAQEQLEQAQTVVAQLTQRVQGLEGELAQAQIPPQAVDEHAQEQIGTLTAELASAEELIQEMEADAAAVRQSLEESHQREENLAIAVQEADAEVGALREQISALELQLEGALSDLSEQRAQFVESSKEHQAVQVQAAETLEAVRSEAAALLAAKEQELAVAAEFKGYAEAAGARVVELEALLEEAQAKAASTDAYVASLKEEAAAALEALQIRLGAAERELEAKEEAICAAKAAAAASVPAPSGNGNSTVMHTHRQDVDSQELTQESIEAARREMEKAVEAMRAELGTKEAEVSRLMAASAEWADRATRAERIVQESEQRATGAASEDEALRKRVGQLQTQCDLLRSERDVAAKKLSETEAELRTQAGRSAVAEEALMAQLQQQQAKLDKMTVQAGEAQRLLESVRALEAKAAATREERDEFKGYAEAAGARVVELEALLEEAQAKAAALSQAAGAGMDALVASLKDEAAVAVRAVTEAVARGDQLELDLGEANLRLKKSREEMVALRSEWDRSGAQLSALEEAKAALEAQRDEFKGYAEAAGARVVELEAGEASLQQQLEEALGQVQALTEALTEAESLTLALPVSAPAPAADPALLAEATARADEAESEAAQLREALSSGRQQARAAVDGLQQRLTATLGELQALRDDLTEKDKRIAHLETTKLTQDQLNKIKAVKEERKRLSEDNKVMKKQLQQLKKVYDDLKASGSSASSSSSASAGAAAGVEAGDLRAQLEAAQGVAQTLKDKLRECGQQLQVRYAPPSPIIFASRPSSSLFPFFLFLSLSLHARRSTRRSALQWLRCWASTAWTRRPSRRPTCPCPWPATTGRAWASLATRRTWPRRWRSWRLGPKGRERSWRNASRRSRRRQRRAARSSRPWWRTATTCAPRRPSCRSCWGWRTSARPAAPTTCRARSRPSRRRTSS